MKILIYTSPQLGNKLQKSLKDTSTHKELRSKSIHITLKQYSFKNDMEVSSIKNEPDIFLNQKRILKSAKWGDYDSVVFIPPTSLNLKGNFMWYSVGNPEDSIVLISSWLYGKIFSEVMSFAGYVLAVYAQYLSRHLVNLEEPHIESRNCLNDFCGDQGELLNAYKPETDVPFCADCKRKQNNHELFESTRDIFVHVKSHHLIEGKTVKQWKKVANLNTNFRPDGNYSYEIEIYLAKKCVHLSSLYDKLDKLLNDAGSVIDGYSLYEVDGGYRGELELKKAKQADWKRLMKLKNDFSQTDFKDIVNPIFEADGKKYATFDERSIVLKVIISSEYSIKSWDVNSNKAVRELCDLFSDIIDKEQCIFLTIKALETTGSVIKLK